jgi:ABC-type multidrug transport system fused ATPase/permease subunit
MLGTVIWIVGSNNIIYKKLLFKILHAKMKFFNKNSSGRIISRFFFKKLILKIYF